MKIAVLGGGISGLYTATLLSERGYHPQVFEAAPVAGGLCRSETEQGFVHDLSGGHILHSRNDAVMQRMRGWLGPEGTVASRRNTKIYYRGRWVKYPFENGLADLPREDTFDCLKGYVDAYVVRQQGAPEPDDFRRWIQWRMGDGIARTFMLPYNEKLWCSDLTDVSTSWVRGRVPEAPVDDVLKSALGITTEGYTHQLQFYYPRQGGFGAFTDALASGLGQLLRLATPVKEVEALSSPSGGFAVNGERFDQVINTIPLQELYRTLRPLPSADVREAVDGLRYLSIATVLIGIDRPHLSDHSWIYLPHAENGPVNRLTYLANYSPGNAPTGTSSILAEVTFDGRQGPREGPALEKEVVASLEKNGFFRGDEVRLVRSASFRYAYPYYDLGFEARMARIRAHLEALGIHTLGRFGAYRYVNTDQVVMMVDEFLASRFPPR